MYSDWKGVIKLLNISGEVLQAGVQYRAGRGLSKDNG